MSRQVRARRRGLDITQAGLGAAIGVSRQAIVAIEKGGNPSLSTALAIGRALNTPLTDLFPELDHKAAEELETISSRTLSALRDDDETDNIDRMTIPTA